MTSTTTMSLPTGVPTGVPTGGPTGFGPLLRQWRQARRLTQMDLAGDAGMSTRHLSFVETGRARPSRELVLRLAERLALPLRERNAMLLAAGFAPVYGERALDDPALGPARAAVERVLAAHQPFPAMAVDRHWTLLAQNAAVAPLLAGVAPSLLTPPVNVLRLSLHPQGLAPRIANLGEWRAHILERLAQQIRASGDPILESLREELQAYPGDDPAAARAPPAYEGIALPLRLHAGDGRILSFIGITTVFGTPLDVTLAELALETFFPADDFTAAALQAMAPG